MLALGQEQTKRHPGPTVAKHWKPDPARTTCRNASMLDPTPMPADPDARC